MITVQFLLLIFALKLGILPASGWPRDCPLILPGLAQELPVHRRRQQGGDHPASWRCPWAASPAGHALRAPSPWTCSRKTTSAQRAPRASASTSIMSRHVLRNALLPLTTMLGFAFIGLLHRLILRRDDYRHPRLRPADARSDQQPRLRHDHGHHDDRRRPVRRGFYLYRYRLHDDRSEGQVWLKKSLNPPY